MHTWKKKKAALSLSRPNTCPSTADARRWRVRGRHTPPPDNYWSSDTSAWTKEATERSSLSAVHSSSSEQSGGLWSCGTGREILYLVFSFINHTCLWVNSQLHRFNKSRAGRPRRSMCLTHTSVREIIMEILRGRWTLITAQNKSRGNMRIDRRSSPPRLQPECGIETTPSIRTSQVILLLEGDSDYAG